MVTHFRSTPHPLLSFSKRFCPPSRLSFVIWVALTLFLETTEFSYPCLPLTRVPSPMLFCNPWWDFDSCNHGSRWQSRRDDGGCFPPSDDVLRRLSPLFSPPPAGPGAWFFLTFIAFPSSRALWISSISTADGPPAATVPPNEAALLRWVPSSPSWSSCTSSFYFSPSAAVYQYPFNCGTVNFD